MDLMPTIVEATRATYPKRYMGQAIQPMEGVSLVGNLKGEALMERSIGFEHRFARAWRKGDWKIAWGKRMPEEAEWELYNLAVDRTERNNLANSHPERVAALAAEWMEWAHRIGVKVTN